MISHEASTGWPNQKPHVFEIHIFAATTDINHAVRAVLDGDHDRDLS